MEGEPIEDTLAWMLLGNTRLYGGRVHLTPEAVIDDGQLDVLALCPDGLFEALRLAARLPFGGSRQPGSFGARACKVTIETAGLPVQLDGDFTFETPCTFSVDQAALLVSVPPGPLAPIFARPHVNRRRQLD
jgi:diacylglycerol kinase family enzyme